MATGRAVGVAFERRGAGEPLLLIHGTGGSRSVCEPVTDRLAADVELAGCGHVPMWDDPGLVARTVIEGMGASAPTAR